MNKIYQKTFPGVKNAAKCRLGGFTLIELLVVVLIIGILAAVAVPKYQKAVKRSRASVALPWIREIYNAQMQYYTSNGKTTPCLNEFFEDNSFSSSGGNCVAIMSKGAGNKKITLHSSYTNGGGVGFAVYVGNYTQSGNGGYGILLNPGKMNYSLYCAEYACYAVEAGSFCPTIMASAQESVSVKEEAWCRRSYPMN